MHVAFVWRGSVRVEVEAAHGVSEDGATEAAVRLSEHAREQLAGG